MAIGIYKKGQGYYTRLCTAIAFALLVGMGAWWLSTQLNTIDYGFPAVYVSAGSALVMVTVFGLLGFWLIGRRPGTVDFLVSTEGEMKKVNWSTRREVVGSTVIVILLSILIAVLCWVFDYIFAWFFATIDVLEPNLS
jgi:preprotein translocase SecE subunit